MQKTNESLFLFGTMKRKNHIQNENKRFCVINREGECRCTVARSSFIFAHFVCSNTKYNTKFSRLRRNQTTFLIWIFYCNYRLTLRFFRANLVIVLTREAETGALCFATSASSLANSSSPSHTDEDPDDEVVVIFLQNHSNEQKICRLLPSFY